MYIIEINETKKKKWFVLTRGKPLMCVHIKIWKINLSESSKKKKKKLMVTD